MKAEVLRIFNDDKVRFFSALSQLYYIYLTFFSHFLAWLLSWKATIFDPGQHHNWRCHVCAIALDLCPTVIFSTHKSSPSWTQVTIHTVFSSSKRLVSKQIISTVSKWQKCYISEGIKNVISVRKCLNMKGINVTLMKF